MDFLREQLEKRIAELFLEEDRALINLGKAIGAREELQSMLNALNKPEEAGDEPASNVEETLDTVAPEIKITNPNE